MSKVTKCDFCARSSYDKYGGYNHCGVEGCCDCDEAAERFTEYMLAIAKGRANTKTVTINKNNNRRRGK